MVLVLFISQNCYMSTLRLVHYALLLTPACWKSNYTNARLMAFAPSLALDPTLNFGIHSHKTLDTARPFHLLKPNWKPSSSHSIFFKSQLISVSSFCYCLLCVCACVRACVRVCVHSCMHMHLLIQISIIHFWIHCSLCVCMHVCRIVCVCLFFHIILYVNCFGRTVLYVCLEYCI